MEINQFFYDFSFKPRLLVEERDKLEKKFKNREAAIIKHRGKLILPRLLEVIRSTDFDHLTELAQNLKKMEVLMLIYNDYPFPEESPETLAKINRILTARYSAVVGKTAWNIFQHQVDSSAVQDLLSLIYEVDSFGFLMLDEKLQAYMESAINHNNGLAEGLVYAVLMAGIKLDNAFHSLRIEKESNLESLLMDDVLKKALSSDEFIKREGTTFIVRVLNNYSMDEYKQLMRIYFENRDYTQFHTTIVQQAVERLRDPRERLTDWQFLNEGSIRQVQRWLIQRKLQIIFEKDQDNKRLNYWKRFIDYMSDVELIQDPMIAFIYFEEFVIVEYGNIGAAYFYHREGFDRFIHPMSRSKAFINSRSQQNREGMFKVPYSYEQGIPLFIRKLDHRGGWQSRFDDSMREYLNGEF
ncbi:hypothetical protein NST84_06690 [Paenibacillus sp. FSL R7-0345]|uniref:hypothetical protein n=1 Tax=Paenibacillus sp. FSL R7-0345 TaxID=2954535 RepID=UPI003159CE45